MIVWQRPNLLLLDEPTNHLDLATREALSMALNEFEGTVMLVSHDRALLRAVCDEFWMVSRGGVAPFDGDLDDYQRYLLDEAKRVREEIKEAANAAQREAREASAKKAAAVAAAPVLPAAEQRKHDAAQRQLLAEKAKPLKKELGEVEHRMAQLQLQKSEQEKRLSSPLPPVEIAQAGKLLKTVQQELESLETRWLDLSTQVDAVAV
jgi:ATP-binding cassette subfamily F protein 3